MDVFYRARSGSFLTQTFRSTRAPSQIASRTANRCYRVISEGQHFLAHLFQTPLSFRVIDRPS